MSVREEKYEESDIAAALEFDLSKYPSDTWSIKECDEILAIFASDHPDLEKHTGTVIDYREKKVICRPIRKELSDLDPNEIDFPEGTKFHLPTDGTTVRILRYKATVYYVTNKRLNVRVKNGRIHSGTPDYPSIYKRLGGVTDDVLFGQHISYQWCYIVTIISPETCLVSKLPFNSQPRLVYVGSMKMEYYNELLKDTYPPIRFNKFDNLLISKEEALAIYNGDPDRKPWRIHEPSSYPETLYAEIGDKLVKYESADFKDRCKIRGKFPVIEPRFAFIMFRMEILANGELRAKHDEFEPFGSLLVRPTDDLEDENLPLVKIPNYAIGVDERGVYADKKKRNKIYIYSASSTAYKADFAQNFLNLVRITVSHLKAALSPLKHPEISAIESDIIALVDNILKYKIWKMDSTSTPYNPAPLSNGYVPSAPKTTLNKLDIQVDYEMKERNVTPDSENFTEMMKELISKCLSTCDCADFYYLLKYFSSLDISPPTDMRRYYQDKYRIFFDEQDEMRGSPKSERSYESEGTFRKARRQWSSRTSSANGSPRSWSTRSDYRQSRENSEGRKSNPKPQFKKRIPGDKKVEKSHKK
jgi:hypothetical protein